MTGRWTTAAILATALAAVIGCGCGGSLVGNEDSTVVVAFDTPPRAERMDAGDHPDGAEESYSDLADVDAPPPPSCVDQDHDGFGAGCALGPDCDDHDPRVTDQCYRCIDPLRDHTGCVCREGTLPQGCDVNTDTGVAGPDGVCHLGQRECVGGLWTHCQRLHPDFIPPDPAHRYVGPVTACPGTCVPNCFHEVDCLESGDPFPTGSSGVAIGGALAAPFCPSGTRPGGVTATCAPSMGGMGSYTRGTSPQAWLDACAAPGHATLLPGSDDGWVLDNVPFSFLYYSTPFTQVGVASNGLVSFTTSSSQYVNQALPYAGIPNSLFAF